MPSTVIEVAMGPIDGVNKSFTVSAMYVPGSLQVWLNGLLLRKDYDDGWTEQGWNKFKMKEAPIPGDVVQAYFRPL
jgi:hypothetical protein